VDLQFLSIDLREKRARLRAADAAGVESIELQGPSYERIVAAAQPLFEWAHGRVPASSRTPRDSTLVAFEIDALARTLHLAYVAERARPPGPPSASSPDLAWCQGDYETQHTLLREAARTAVREVRPRTEDPPDLTPNSRWEYVYQHGGDGWELGRAAPPLDRYLRQSSPLRAGERALVIGCGRGHEALALAQLAKTVGAQVVAIDIAPTAIRSTQAAGEKAGLQGCLQAVETDLMTGEHQGLMASGTYDLIVEHTCLCAIEPSRRDEYAAAVRRLLKPGGRLIGLFYCHSYPGGPPYGMSNAEVRRLLEPSFAWEHDEVPSDSVLTRAGQEWLVSARRLP